MIPIKLLIGFEPYVNSSFFHLIVRGILLGENNGHLWYCLFIFMAYIVSFFLFHTANKLISHVWGGSADIFVYTLICIIALILYRFGYLSEVTFPGISIVVNRFSSNYLWFCIGLIASIMHNQISLSRRLFLCIKYGSIIGFCFLVICYLFGVGVGMISILIGLFGIIVLYSFIPSKPICLLMKISRNSFGIYLFHSPLVYITFSFLPNIPPVLVLIINFIFFGSLSYFATSLLKKSKLKFVIGE